MPRKPELHLLSIQTPADDDLSERPTLHIPEGLIKAWYHDEAFGTTFQKFVDEFTEEFGVNAASTSTPSKKRPGNAIQTPSPKKAHVDVQQVGIESLPTPLLMKVAINTSSTKGKQISLNIFGGNRLFLLNDGGEDVEIPEGMFIVGFGKGKWHYAGEEDSENKVAVGETGLVYSLTSSNDVVIMNGSRKLLGNVVAEKKATSAEVTINYFTMTPEPGNESSFTLEPSFNVFFKPQGRMAAEADPADGEGEGKPILPSITQTNAGAHVPACLWNSNLTEILWSVKWHTAGLMPTRAGVYTKGVFTLASKHAVEIAA